MKLDSVLIDMVQLDDHRNEYDNDADMSVPQNNMIWCSDQIDGSIVPWWYLCEHFVSPIQSRALSPILRLPWLTLIVNYELIEVPQQSSMVIERLK